MRTRIHLRNNMSYPQHVWSQYMVGLTEYFLCYACSVYVFRDLLGTETEDCIPRTEMACPSCLDVFSRVS